MNEIVIKKALRSHAAEIAQLIMMAMTDDCCLFNTITETLLRFMPDGMMEERIVKYGIKL